jgi:DNA helicase-2/ATP-dependent DNA helicase PcrA
MAKTDVFKKEYEKLNNAQKEAVDTIDGPVMVVAGPGTGKTEILALRIGNILLKTDTLPDSILCLTFTNSGVRAMQSRLGEYMGSRSNGVVISTFHSFALQYLIEKNYQLLGFDLEPKILSDEEAVFLVDEILHENDWQYIRPRTNPEMYFSELKQLISILKRERLTPGEFLSNVGEDIENLKNNPESMSMRGESKGKLKKEIEKKIESLERTREVVEFYRLYEEKKIALSLMDYDDILEYAVKLVEEYENIRADIYENFQYVLIDEHQDSSGVQNNFLKAVWGNGNVEKPNIFVVGDDRQLIYAFSGAKLSYFEEFSRVFGKIKLITLLENYRSTSNILALADDLLQSSLADGKLKSNIKGKDKVSLNEYTFPRDEIIGAGLYFQKKIKEKIGEGVSPEECALLVPRNYHVRSAIEILRNMGLKVSSGKNISLFDVKETQNLLRILGIIADPYNSILLSSSLIDGTSGIDALSAYKFLRNTKPDKLSIEEIKSLSGKKSLFDKDNAIAKWGSTLEHFVNDLSGKSIMEIISVVGNEILIDQAKVHEELIYNVEVVRSLLNAATLFGEKKKNANLRQFLEYLKRIESYGSHIPLATFSSDSGIQVMTLHKSKGMQYKAVWIAHMNEEVFMSEKKHAFTLPEKVKSHLKERDVLSAKRELYVAITRAKLYCNISYANENYGGGALELAHIIRELPASHFIKKSKEETEQEILSFGPRVYVEVKDKKGENSLLELQNFVKENYPDTKISVTLLNNFFECPWKWYFRNFLKLPEIKSKSLVLGSVVHGAIEFILKSKSLPDISLIRGKIKFELERGGVASTAELKKLLKDGESATVRFINDFYKNLAEDYLSERPLSFKDADFPHLLMYGKLDLTERLPNGETVITDFKTGGSKSKNIIEKLDEEGRLSSHLRQLAMYSYLVAGAEKGKTVSLSRLFYLEAPKDDKNVFYSTHITGEQINLLIKDIRDYDELLKSGNWVSRPCNYNSYGKNTECEYCKMAKIYSEI